MRYSPKSSPREKRQQGSGRSLAALLALVAVAGVASLCLSSPGKRITERVQSQLFSESRHARVLLATKEGVKIVAKVDPTQDPCKCEGEPESTSAADVASLSSQKEQLQKQLNALEAAVVQLAKEKAKLAKDKASALEQYVALRNQLADGESALTEVKDRLAKDKQPKEDRKLLAEAAAGGDSTGPAGLEGESKKCAAYLRDVQVKLASAEAQVDQVSAEKATLQSSLDESKSQLKLAKEELEAAKVELRQSKASATGAGDAGKKGDAVAARIAAAQDPQGYRCSATPEDMRRYNDYTIGGNCPNDWYFVQRLIFKKNCFSLPRRRCRALTPESPTEPLPLPKSLFNQSALDNRNVRWDLHQCKSFECLNERTAGDCRQCFNLTLEETRWKVPYRGTIPMAQVIAMKNGTLRLGLDAGGGTGSFAAHMASFGVTVLTTAFNIETVSGMYAGLPYHETIAARGLVPLHVPHQSRLPLFDGVLDVIHSVNSIKYIPLLQFEELIYEWDRVLRVGGIFWFEMFYAPVDDMPKYVEVIEKVGFKKLYWQFTPKTDAAELPGKKHVYLNCVLEKQPNPGKEVLGHPREEDMIDIFSSE